MKARIEEKKHIFTLPYKGVRIKLLGDLQYCSSLQRENLTLLEGELTKEKIDYLCIPGDLIDSTNFLYDNRPKTEELLLWLENISKAKQVFICLGNHDLSKMTPSGWTYDFNENFWKEVSAIPNIHVSHFNPHYEDENIYMFMLELNYDYYYNNKVEDKEMLISQLKAYRRLITDIDQSKLKIMLIHSPVHITNPEVLSLVNEFDFIFAGHMHNGVVPPAIDKIIPGNRGIIAPNKELFPDNARGIKTIKIGDKEVRIIITGGITKLAECAGALSKINNIFFPMSIDDIEIKAKTLTFHK